MTRYQKGIFYKDKPLTPVLGRAATLRNSTFAALFLRIVTGSSAHEAEKSLENLWNLYTSLRTGQMSFLIGYSPRIFSLNGVKKAMPENLRRQFLPTSNVNRDILEGCAIKYSKETRANLGQSEDIMIQIISNTQLATFNAIVETSKYLRLYHKEKVLQFSRFYTGFQRNDGRSWLGFHDEISNLSSENERRKVIFVNPVANNLRLSEYWTRWGTYLAFIRMEIDVLGWERINPIQQELIVGRRKRNGMPLIGVNKRGTPQTIDKFNRITSTRMIRDHPDYFRTKNLPPSILRKLDVDASIRILTQSHVGRTRHMDQISSGNVSSRRIYRQSFEFIEPLFNSEKPLRLGTNFISFQNDPSRLFFILTDPNWMGQSNFGGESGKLGISDLLSVLAAGVFYVPPMEKPFPGTSIFV